MCVLWREINKPAAIRQEYPWDLWTRGLKPCLILVYPRYLRAQYLRGQMIISFSDLFVHKRFGNKSYPMRNIKITVLRFVSTCKLSIQCKSLNKFIAREFSKFKFAQTRRSAWRKARLMKRARVKARWRHKGRELNLHELLRTRSPQAKNTWL